MEPVRGGNASPRGKRVMIVTGEASGDLHGSNLVRAMQAVDPALSFCGLGGRELAAVGVEILHDVEKLAVVGLVEVVSHLPHIMAARSALLKRLRETPPDLLILIDYPDFNFLIGEKAKPLGIPIFYYISPQVWAWRSRRAEKIGRLADRIGVILPFEQAFYQERGIKVDFVGHPLLDAVQTRLTAQAFRQQWRIPSKKTVIGLLPGSRRKEISRLLPLFLKAALLLTEVGSSEYVFLIPRASTVAPELLEKHGLIAYQDRLDIRVIDEDRYDLMASCEAVWAASGTVTLELAMLGVPMVVAYQLGEYTYQLGRILVKLDYFTLVNLVAKRRVVPELLQEEVTPRNLVIRILAFLDNSVVRKMTCEGLAEVVEKLGGGGASKRAAAIACELLADKPV